MTRVIGRPSTSRKPTVTWLRLPTGRRSVARAVAFADFAAAAMRAWSGVPASSWGLPSFIMPSAGLHRRQSWRAHPAGRLLSDGATLAERQREWWSFAPAARSIARRHYRAGRGKTLRPPPCWCGLPFVPLSAGGSPRTDRIYQVPQSADILPSNSRLMSTSTLLTSSSSLCASSSRRAASARALSALCGPTAPRVGVPAPCLA